MEGWRGGKQIVLRGWESGGRWCENNLCCRVGKVVAGDGGEPQKQQAPPASWPGGGRQHAAWRVSRRSQSRTAAQLAGSRLCPTVRRLCAPACLPACRLCPPDCIPARLFRLCPPDCIPARLFRLCPGKPARLCPGKPARRCPLDCARSTVRLFRMPADRQITPRAGFDLKLARVTVSVIATVYAQLYKRFGNNYRQKYARTHSSNSFHYLLQLSLMPLA